MSNLLSTSFLELVFLYSALSWFAGHQASNLVAIGRGEAELNPALAILLKITSSMPLYFGVLIWVGYRTQWYYPLVIFVVSMFVRPFVFVTAEKALGLTKNAWIISLIGILAIPMLTVAIVYVVSTS